MNLLNAPRTLAVLLVDSDDERRALHAQSFAGAGWQVADAESGPIALAKALSAVPDIVVVDLRLPGMDGAELIRILRRDPDTAHVPTVLVSGDAESSAAERASASGAALVITDPFLPAALVARAAELVLARNAIGDRQVVLDQIRPGAAGTERPLPGPPCPDCGSGLTFSRTHTTHVGRRTEQWVHYRCRRGCGDFEYRERTRKIRKIS